MSKLSFIIFLIFFSSIGFVSIASEDHKHEAEAEHVHKTDDSHGDHSNKDEHEDSHDAHSGDDEHKEIESKTIVGIENEGKRIKLSPEAIKTLKVKLSKCSLLENNTMKIPENSLVKFGNKKGIYLHNNDWFELVELESLKKVESGYLVGSHEFKNWSDKCEIVTSGIELIRVAQLEASGEGGEGHAH